MRAMVINAYGGPDVLESAELPRPEPGGGQVLIRVRAAAVNPADGKWRQGMFEQIMPMPFPAVLGYDIAGEIVSGSDWPAGTRVTAMLNPVTKGGYAEYALADAGTLAPIPDDMEFATAAAVPTASLTGLQMVERAAQVKPGQAVLITGALGSVGRVAMHYAIRAGARVVAAVRASAKQAALDAGAAQAIALGEEEWSGAPFDHVIDTVGGAAVGRLAAHLAAGGTIITAATTPVPPDGLPTEPHFYAVQPDGADLARILADVAAGAIAMPVEHMLPLERAAQAQALVDAGGLSGKVVLIP